MTTIAIVAQSQSQDVARVAQLRREIGMLRIAQSHLRGIPARHNLRRIADRVDLLATLETLVSLHADELAHISLEDR